MAQFEEYIVHFEMFIYQCVYVWVHLAVGCWMWSFQCLVRSMQYSVQSVVCSVQYSV